MGCNQVIPECKSCKLVGNVGCGSSIKVSLGLNASTTYYLNLIDKFDIETSTSVTTDLNGDFTITQTWLDVVEAEIFTDSAHTDYVDCVIFTDACTNSLNFQQTCNSQYLWIT